MLPNPFGARRDYVEGFALSEAEFKLVREDLAPESHKFLVKPGHESVVVELDLSGLADALEVLSGPAETTAVADEIIAEEGGDSAVRSEESRVRKGGVRRDRFRGTSAQNK